MPNFVIVTGVKERYPRTVESDNLYMCVSTDGVFLNISTAYARTGSGYVVPSACAKAGIEALTKYVTLS